MNNSVHQKLADAALRLEATIPEIESALNVANAPSVSLGVIHEGSVIFRKSIGLRDVNADLEATSETSYHIASCSKVITATALGILVAEGKVFWDDPIRKHPPSFNPTEDPRIGAQATVIDACRHTTGLANILFQGPNGALIHREDHIPLVNALPTSDHDGQRFRECWFYSSGAFGLLALVTEAASGMKYSDFLRQRVLAPLVMTQTHLNEDDVETNDNLAHPYVQMTDGEWSKINNHITTDKNSPFLSSAGIRNSVDDLLAFLAAVMNRFDIEKGLDHPQPLLNEVLESPLREGWYRTTIPTGALGLTSYNAFHDDDSATRAKQLIGHQSEPRTLYGHNGIANGSLATVYCFPSSHTAIVVLGNAAEAGDAPESISQILIQAVFDLKPHVDLVPLLRQQRERCLKTHDDMVGDWKQGRDVSKYTGSAQDLIGSYLGLDTCRISITASDTAEAGLP
ncbi:unnamed protein product [Penicillium salamii]|uniref:Beta-lactamase-related domain-containing protein n=1 Tax=Penicillium salamii TaxID=1612424 RepID=A0A9W4JEZ4_9EURO|nr:unnamed protein product [Penicillium salamii]